MQCGACGEAQPALGWLIRLLGGVFDANPREVDGAVVAVERDGEGRFGLVGDGEVAGQDVAGAHGDDAHAHAGSCHAGGDGAHGPVSARGDDDGGSLLEGAYGLPGAWVFARGLPPVHVVDAQFLGGQAHGALEAGAVAHGEEGFGVGAVAGAAQFLGHAHDVTDAERGDGGGAGAAAGGFGGDGVCDLARCIHTPHSTTRTSVPQGV